MAKSKSKCEIEVVITVVPTDGNTTTKEARVAKTGTTLGEVLSQAGISAENKDLLLNGRPADLKTYVAEGDKVSAKARTARVQVSERPQGS